jgi:dolichol-phosphate mannosyltransferase
MLTHQKFALVVPTLNEAGNIEPLLLRTKAALEAEGINYEVIIVDDGSSDGTQREVRRFAEADPRIRLLVREGEKGLSGAVVHGWQNTDADLLGAMDADLQHPPELLPELVRAIEEGHDIAIASRYVGSRRVEGWNPFRQAISWLTTLTTLPLQRPGVHVKDPMSGFFLVRRESIEGIHLQPQGFKILLEILVRGRIHSAAEIPFRFAPRHAGKSKADVKVAFYYFSLLGKLSRDLLFGSSEQ